jgi:phage terminase small subunit
MNELNPKQTRFVAEYCVDLNASAAAKRAGYSEKTAYSIGHELLNKPEVEEAIAEAQAKRAARTEVTQDNVIRRLAEIAFSDLTDFSSWAEDGDITLIASDAIDPSKIAALKEISSTTTSVMFKGDEKTTVKKSVKLEDRLKAFDMLCRHLGVYNDKLNLEGNIGLGELFEQVRKKAREGEA